MVELEAALKYGWPGLVGLILWGSTRFFGRLFVRIVERVERSFDKLDATLDKLGERLANGELAAQKRHDQAELEAQRRHSELIVKLEETAKETRHAISAGLTTLQADLRDLKRP